MHMITSSAIKKFPRPVFRKSSRMPAALCIGCCGWTVVVVVVAGEMGDKVERSQFLKALGGQEMRF